MTAIATFTLATTLLSGPVAVLDVDKDHSDVSFSVRHIVSRARGRFDDFEGTVRFDRERPERSSVEFTVRTASVNTNVAARDEHLRSPDFFDVEKHPTMSFRSTGVVARGEDLYDVTGVFQLRGMAKTMTLPVRHLGFQEDPWGNLRSGFRTTAVLDRKEFGMVWNKGLDKGGVILGDEVEVTIDLEVIQRKEPEPQ